MMAALRSALLWSIAFAAIYAGFAVSRGVGGAVAAAVVVLVVSVRSVLPRAAHRAFVRGNPRRARLTYGLLGTLSPRPEARAACRLSRAACTLAAGAHGRALVELDRIDGDRLGEPARAVWLNNRAYALARLERDLPRALDLARRAVELRPDVAGFRHTRGLVLLGLGRTDEAIRDLDAVWREGGEGRMPSLLEAERCFDLGCAWWRKGERDYADDYFRRSRQAAPGSPWADRALERLGPGSAVELVPEELLG